MRILSLAPAFLLAALCLEAAPAADRPSAPPPPDANELAPAPEAKAGDLKRERADPSEVASAPVKERRTATSHTLATAAGALCYEATAGTLTLRDGQGRPTASMFYVAYVVEPEAGRGPRPVTFLYNGGPGSSSMWLHMGSIGPLRVRTDSPEATHNPPYTVGPNEQSLLGRTDLVFLDAIGTGYSRVLGKSKPEAFWGVDADIDAFAQGITRYLTVNRRWNSPKFLFGESYGTTRSAGLAYALHKRGVQLNGVILLSSILNYGVRNPGYDRTFVGLLPTYAAAAWYHHKSNPRPDQLEPLLAEVRAYASGPYLLALDKGQDITAQEEDSVAQKLSGYTGLSVTFLKENRLRVEPGRFRKELLRAEHRILGRYDARVVGIDPDDAGEEPEYDPASAGISGAFVGALQATLVDELHFPSDLAYLPSGGEAIFKAWDWHHRAPGDPYREVAPDVARDLSSAMRENPHLKVLSLNGWYDLATPFYETEYDLKHMHLDPSLRQNLRFAYYPSGHMVYLNPEALKQLISDLERFYGEAAPR